MMSIIHPIIGFLLLIWVIHLSIKFYREFRYGNIEVKMWYGDCPSPDNKKGENEVKSKTERYISFFIVISVFLIFSFILIFS